MILMRLMKKFRRQGVCYHEEFFYDNPAIALESTIQILKDIFSQFSFWVGISFTNDINYMPLSRDTLFAVGRFFEFSFCDLILGSSLRS